MVFGGETTCFVPHFHGVREKLEGFPDGTAHWYRTSVVG